MTVFNRQPGPDYAATITVDAAIESAFTAVASLDGLSAWWTTQTSGSADLGSELKFEFPGAADSPTLMRVEESDGPLRVRWTCLEAPLQDWVGTALAFEFTASGPGRTEISFRHAGLQPELECFDTCSAGWNHHLHSLASYLETGAGQPYGS